MSRPDGSGTAEEVRSAASGAKSATCELFPSPTRGHRLNAHWSTGRLVGRASRETGTVAEIVSSAIAVVEDPGGDARQRGRQVGPHDEDRLEKDPGPILGWPAGGFWNTSVPRPRSMPQA